MWSTKNKCCFFDDREEKSLILFRRPLEMDKQTNKVKRQSLPKTSPLWKSWQRLQDLNIWNWKTFDHKVLRDAFSSGHSVSSDVLYPLLKNVGSSLLSLTFQNLPWRQFWSKHRCWWLQCASVQIERSIWTAGCSAETTWKCQTFRIFAHQVFLISHGF